MITPVCSTLILRIDVLLPHFSSTFPFSRASDVKSIRLWYIKEQKIYFKNIVEGIKCVYLPSISNLAEDTITAKKLRRGAWYITETFLHRLFTKVLFISFCFNNQEQFIWREVLNSKGAQKLYWWVFIRGFIVLHIHFNLKNNGILKEFKLTLYVYITV